MDLFNPHDLSRYPWPALLVAEGEIVGATAAMYSLLGLEPPAVVAELFDCDDANGQVLSQDQLPWKRLARGEFVDERETWVNRRTGRRFALRVHACKPSPLVTVFDDSARARSLELSSLPATVVSVLLEAEDIYAATHDVVGAINRALGKSFVCVLEGAKERFVLRACAGLDEKRTRQLRTILESHAAVAMAGRREASSFEAIDELPQQHWIRGLLQFGARCALLFPLDLEERGSHRLLIGLPEATDLAVAKQGLIAVCAAWALVIQRGRGGEAEQRARRGMRALAEAALTHETKLPLRELLRLLVAQACELTRAQYGALGVLNRAHAELEDFITVGVSDEQAARIGHLPTGKGLLGAVISEARTIRVSEMAHDPRTSGFPHHHPPMKSFLGVPLRVGAEVFGNFYLTDKQGGEDFTEEDARLLEAFSAQAALTVSYARESDAQKRVLNAVLRQAPHGILFFAGEGQVAFSNAAAESMLGAAVGRDSPGTTYDLFSADGQRIETADLPSMRALNGEVVTNLEVSIHRSGAEPLPAFASAAPVLSDTGTRLGAIVAFQDITAFKELERTREEFAAVVAHDLRSPLQAMMMPIAQLLRTKRSDPLPVPAASLEKMQRSGERLTHLISDLLDASRIEGKRLQLSRKPVLLPEVVSALVGQLEPTLGGHLVTIDVSGDPPPVLADLLRLEQILANLFDNAAKYSAAGTAIKIAIVPEGPGSRVSVSDRGPGILPEDMPHLFDRYFQAKRAREKRTGLGLGLYITKGFVDAHGGQLWVESSPGEGSTFHVWLPATESGKRSG